MDRHTTQTTRGGKTAHSQRRAAEKHTPHTHTATSHSHTTAGGIEWSRIELNEPFRKTRLSEVSQENFEPMD